MFKFDLFFNDCFKFLPSFFHSLIIIICIPKSFITIEIKRRSTVFYALEVQTQYLSTIANMENLMDNSYYSNMEMKLLNKKTVSPSLQKRDKAPVIIENFGKETQKLIEEEFNKSKYVTSHKTEERSSILKNSRENSPNAFKFKRKSYLGEAISKEDLNDPIAFEYALRKIAHTHVEKLVRQ